MSSSVGHRDGCENLSSCAKDRFAPNYINFSIREFGLVWVLQPHMETSSFVKIVERRVRKVLKAEEEHGESQQRA